MADFNDTEASSEKKVTDDDAVLDFDKILQEEVGQFGCFQFRNIVLALIAVIFLAWTNNSYVFYMARIRTRCHVPECENALEPEFAPDWLLHAIPGTDLRNFDNCQRYANVSEAVTEDGECPATWFEKDQLRSCDQYVYETNDTIVYDFGLGCDEWRRSIVGSIRISATILAQSITGYISDRWGRRTALVFNAFNAGWMGILKSFSPNYIVFVVEEFISAVIGSASFQASYILIMELVSPDKRVIVGACMNTSLSVGHMLMGLIAWAVPYWRDLIRVLFVPQLITISYLWLMTESVRWYISRDRYEDVEKTLTSIARANKRQLSNTSLEAIRKKAEEAKIKKKKMQEIAKQDENQEAPSLLKELFRYKPVLFRCLIVPFMWITFTLVFHGISINAVEISGNKYVSYISTTGAQIPGFWISLLLLDKIGRKPVLIGAYWICAVCEIVFIFVPKSQYALGLTVYMIGASCSGAVFIALYIYTAELFPTQYRHRLFGFCSSVGRLGAILAPLTPALGVLVWEPFPFALFAGCACVAGTLVLFAPETRGVRLPATMAEAAQLGKNT